jgi:hypothetical protein
VIQQGAVLRSVSKCLILSRPTEPRLEYEESTAVNAETKPPAFLIQKATQRHNQ